MKIGSILKRTLSESFAGVPVPMTETCETNIDKNQEFRTKKNRPVLNAKSLSLELARQKHRLAAQLVSIYNNLLSYFPYPSVYNIMIRASFNRVLIEKILRRLLYQH